MTVPAAALLLGAVSAASGCAERIPAPPAVTASPAPIPAAPPRPVLPDIAGPEAGFRAAMETFKKGDSSNAALYAQSVMERYPRTAWAKRSLFLLGRTLLLRVMTADAGKVMLRVPEEYPDLADYALFSLAEGYAAVQRFADAASLYQRLTENYPASSLAARASLRRAQALFDAGAVSDASAAFERTIADYPQSDEAARAALGLGRSRAEAGDLPGAVKAYLLVRISYAGSGADDEADKALAALAVRGAEVPKLTGD